MSPRVWEKIYEGMMEKGREVKGLKRAIATNCKKAGLKHHLEGRDGIFYKLGTKAIYKKIKEALGLDRYGMATRSIDQIKILKFSKKTSLAKRRLK